MALTRSSIIALIIIINKPNDIRIAGNDSRTAIGLTTRLTKARIKPEITMTLN
jgi:hypothetical protein